ncbi:MAG: hypothetical protein IPL65_12695 [Lewinellaceae bacterium]|nr:hypothetical protein [Lewinellaceae bacterium]
MLPPPFVSQMQALIPGEYPAFEKALGKPAPISIRLNPGKSGAEPNEIAGAPISGPVPWHPNGRYLANRPVFTLDPLLHAGSYYVQEASSMFLFQAVKQACANKASLKILDMCAAPGGKSTLLSDLIGPEGLLVSNEYVRSRVNPCAKTSNAGVCCL